MGGEALFLKIGSRPAGCGNSDLVSAWILGRDTKAAEQTLRLSSCIDQPKLATRASSVGPFLLHNILTSLLPSSSNPMISEKPPHIESYVAPFIFLSQFGYHRGGMGGGWGDGGGTDAVQAQSEGVNSDRCTRRYGG